MKDSRENFEEVSKFGRSWLGYMFFGMHDRAWVLRPEHSALKNMDLT
jgi:hypothetical protein